MERFKLSQVFLDKYKGQQPTWGFGDLSYFTFKRCVDISTPVLCDDLRWIPAGELKEGQGIIGFDDFENGNLRHIRFGKVLYNKIEKAKTIGIELEDGTIIYATPDHRWLIKLDGDNRLYWKETQDLQQTKKGNPVYLVRPFGPVWNDDKTYEGGFLSAAFDGEGCFDRINSLSFIQVENPMMRQVEEFLDARKINYQKRMKKQIEGRQDCFTLRINSRRNFIPLLGSARPPRLLEKFKKNVKDNDNDIGALRCNPDDYVKVIKIFDGGERNIAVLSTDLGTHFTAGFASHNTYARNLEDGKTEEFWQTLQRVVEGVFTIQKKHCADLKLYWDNRKAHASAQKMFEKMWNFKFLPPGRGLWAMGTKMIDDKGGAALNNCGFVSTADISKEGLAFPFTWAMDMLMLGVGIGFDTKGKGFVVKEPKSRGGEFIIDDTREGWVEALNICLSAFCGNNLPSFNFSKIREAGAPIVGFGGVASGPEPLKELLESLDKMLSSKVGEELTSVDIVDIMNLIGRAVVAGNVRRSAEVAIGEADDAYFIECKDPVKYEKELNSHRWASNNSVRARMDTDLSLPAKYSAKNGEPGYIFEDTIKAYGRLKDAPDYVDFDFAGLNPCLEQVLESYELCCLVETFPANHSSAEEFYETLKYAYLYAKSVTLITTHEPRTNAVLLRNRRIGVSQSGIEQAKAKFGAHRYYREFCDKGYEIIQQWDKVYSRWLCIPRSKRTTSVKPSGTVSLLAGATAGVHYDHSEYYYRTIRISKQSSLLDILRAAGYRIEDDVTAPKLTAVVYFPVKSSNFTKSKFDVTIWEQLNNVSQMQRYWADNSVSCTVTFKSEESADIPMAIEMYRDRLKAVSFLPLDTNTYAQMPYQRILKDEYESYVSQLKPFVFEDSIVESDRTDDKYCNGLACEIPVKT